MAKIVLFTAEEYLKSSLSYNDKQSILNLFTDSEGNTPLHKSKSREMTLLLLHFGFQTNTANAFGALPIHVAAANGNRSVVHTFVDDNSINEATTNGETPLFIAASAGQKDIVELLLKCGADTMVTNVNGKTPLHVAASKNHYDIVKVS